MVRVLIERWLKPGTEHDFHLAMREMRREAAQCAGYISGETLRDSEDHQHYVVLSTWGSMQDWNTWAVSGARQDGRTRIAPMLTRAEKVTVLELA